MIISIFAAMIFLMIQVMFIVRKSMKNLSRGENSALNLLKQCKMKKNAKLAKLFIIIAVGFLGSWVPIITGLVINGIRVQCMTRRVLRILASFIQINCCINILVYVIKDKNFMGTCLQLLRYKPNQVGPQAIANS